MCGDYVVVVLVLPSGLGSPPRVQGLPLLGDVLVTPSRITPACAGTTTWVAVKYQSYRITPACAGTTGSGAGK